jgi:hypothetical protein
MGSCLLIAGKRPGAALSLDQISILYWAMLFSLSIQTEWSGYNFALLGSEVARWL